MTTLVLQCLWEASTDHDTCVACHDTIARLMGVEAFNVYQASKTPRRPMRQRSLLTKAGLKGNGQRRLF